MKKSKLQKALYVAVFAVSVQSFSAANADHAGSKSESPEAAAVRKHLDVEFSPEVEAQLALTGGPTHIRENATVYVYKMGKGYKLYKEGTNGFTCLLNRDAFFYGRTAFKPTCWDEEGKDSYVPVMLSVGKWLAKGKTTSEIKALVDKGFEKGKFKSPDKTGVAYMVAGDLDLDLKSAETLKVFFPGHHMYYAPNVTTAQLGGQKEFRKNDPSLPRIFAGGAGGERLGYIISMVGHAQAN